jgi:hypothetical protein
VIKPRRSDDQALPGHVVGGDADAVAEETPLIVAELP